MLSKQKTSIRALLRLFWGPILACFCTFGPVFAQQIEEFKAIGPSEAFNTELERFRSHLRDVASGEEPQAWFEETWDSTAPAHTDPRPFPPAPGRDRRAAPGLVFRTLGDTEGFLVSSPVASEQPARFGLPLAFIPQSEEQMFVPTGGTTFEVAFVSPKNEMASAESHAFGLVFVDVDTEEAVTLRYYDRYDNLLLRQTAEPAPAGSSLLGAVFDKPILHRVTVQAGTAALLGNRRVAPGRDGVVIDNLIYGLPHTEEPPFIVAMVLAVVLFALVGAMRAETKDT